MKYIPERTARVLDLWVKPARLTMTPTKEVMYANEETGTVVYRVLTCNSTLPSEMKTGAFEKITWCYFLVGNEKGYAQSSEWVDSQADFRVNKITEDDKEVTIERSGTQTVMFGLRTEVENLVFEKAKFTPYEKEKPVTPQENPYRYDDKACVSHKDHGFGRTFNPRVGSEMVDVDFGNGKILSIHENELKWAITYSDKCLVFGLKIGKSGTLTWLCAPNEKLGGRSPRNALDDGDLELAERVFDETFDSD